MTSDRSSSIGTIGVIGAGQMGSGIAHVCALAGFEVQLADVEAKKLESALSVIDRNLTRQVARGKIAESDKGAAVKRIKIGTSYEMFAQCDIVIEAAMEKEDLKREIFKKLVPHLKSSAIISSNTSSISITRLPSSTARPDPFIRMPVLNPEQVLPLAERLPGIATVDPALRLASTVT